MFLIQHSIFNICHSIFWFSTIVVQYFDFVCVGCVLVQDILALGVFDGHSGSEAAQFAQEKLLGHVKVSRSGAYIPFFCVELC